jgi:hypothetical protein
MCQGLRIFTGSWPAGAYHFKNSGKGLMEKKLKGNMQCNIWIMPRHHFLIKVDWNV